jgi:sucrose synthase
MPKLYHVIDGVELFSPKFNVVFPGVDESIFFPYTKTADRIDTTRRRLEDLVFTADDPAKVSGRLDDPSLPPMFTMARLDRIKILTGLAECFGKSERLRRLCNLIIVAGRLQADASNDEEEKQQIERLRAIIDAYDLHGKIRWLGVRLSKADSGELYRVIADHRGIFVQPALFEAFGLTVLEAMISGLPTFATRFGGPLEIITDNVNGFWINPTDYESTAATIAEFLETCKKDQRHWDAISKRAVERAYSPYTWRIHTERLLSLAKMYGFWNLTSRQAREDLTRYFGYDVSPPVQTDGAAPVGDAPATVSPSELNE